MKSRVIAALAGLGLALSVAGAAQAQIRVDRPVGGGQQGGGDTGGGMMTNITPEQGMRLLQQAGMQRPEIKALKSGMKVVVGSMGGSPTAVYFYGTDKNAAADSLTFNCYFNPPDGGLPKDFLNNFNQNWRYSRVYTDSDGDVNIVMDVTLAGGVSQNWIVENAKLFVAMVGHLKSGQ